MVGPSEKSLGRPAAAHSTQLLSRVLLRLKFPFVASRGAPVPPPGQQPSAASQPESLPRPAPGMTAFATPSCCSQESAAEVINATRCSLVLEPRRHSSGQGSWPGEGLTCGAVQVGSHGNLPQPLLVQERGEELVGVAEPSRLDQVDVCGKARAPAADNAPLLSHQPGTRGTTCVLLTWKPLHPVVLLIATL